MNGDFTEQLIRRSWSSFVTYDRLLGALLRNAANAPKVTRKRIADDARTLAALVDKRATEPLDRNQLLNMRRHVSKTAGDFEHTLRRITNLLIDGKQVDLAYYLVLAEMPGKRPQLDVIVEYRVRDLLGPSFDAAPVLVRQALEAIIMAGEFDAADDYARQTGWKSWR